VQTGNVASKYDDYWTDQLDQISVQLQNAAAGTPAALPVPGLARSGERQSWHGTAEIRARELTQSSGAHATSLGKTVAASGICTQWPERLFRFMISADGQTLMIAALADHHRDARSAPRPGDDSSLTRPRGKRQSIPRYEPNIRDSDNNRSDTDDLYRILDRLTARSGGLRRLRDCTGASGCPPQGIYFFYEDGESRADGSRRIVRIGTHALTQTSTATLWNRLRQHRGYLGGRNPGGGNHRGSVFRRHVGAALIRRASLPDDLLRSWLDRHRQPAERNPREADTERDVSRYIGAMPFLWLSVPGRADRGYLESNTIALLSCRTGGPDLPSTTWLGRFAERAEISGSGLWNIHHVTGQHDPGFLHRLARIVDDHH